MYKVVKEISAEIFRAYDIRGIVAQDLDEDVLYTIGLALGSEVIECDERQMAIACDGRVSSPMFSTALAKGLMAAGVDVIDLGSVPTPLLYFATNILTVNSGAMITGSHNPANYNGVKMVVAGKTLTDKDIQGIYQRIKRHKFTCGQGQYQKHDVIEAYVKRITDDVKLAKPLKVVVDCGNGIPGMIAPRLFAELGCDVQALYCDVDGSFPNHHPDPSVLENLQDLILKVKATQADIGLAFDGDGDRVGVVTPQGKVIWPDRQMMLYAQDILMINPEGEIIFDVKCTRYLSEVIRQVGGVATMWKTGHSFIKEKLQETGALLAGEMSGHIFFKDRWFGFDDGLYAGARLLEILSNRHEDLDKIFSSFPDSVNTPELKIFVAEDKKFPLMQEIVSRSDFFEAEINKIDGLRVEFSEGWGLVRASNTSPNLILRFEAKTADMLVFIQQKFREYLLAIDETLILPF